MTLPFLSHFAGGIRRLALLSALLSGTLGLHAAEQPIRIKMATLAPKGTSYHIALERMANEWEKVSGGRIKVIVYPGGIQGGEASMIQRMRINSLQASLITATGLAKIVPEVEGLQSIPMLFHSLEEVDYINRELAPEMDQLLREKGFIILFWSDAGWVHFFSKQKIRTPEDLSKLKLFTIAGDPKWEHNIREAGMQPVPMEPGEILTGLKTGYIEAVSMPPFLANANQIYREAPYMLNLNWAPLVGACVINKETWDQIPPDLQEKLTAQAKVTGVIIRKLGRRESEEALETMQQRWGLEVEPVDEALETQWREFAQGTYRLIRGDLVPAEIFDKVRQLLEAYRTDKKSTP